MWMDPGFLQVLTADFSHGISTNAEQRTDHRNHWDKAAAGSASATTLQASPPLSSLERVLSWQAKDNAPIMVS